MKKSVFEAKGQAEMNCLITALNMTAKLTPLVTWCMTFFKRAYKIPLLLKNIFALINTSLSGETNARNINLSKQPIFLT